MKLPGKKYKTITVPELCADPYFQEWVFYPVRAERHFFLDLLACNPETAVRIQTARSKLLNFSGTCQLMRKATVLYAEMKAQLEQEEQTEASFNIVLGYWNAIREQLSGYKFACSNDEIHFFKVIKPLFTGEIEYLLLRNHAELFSGHANKFWQRQPKRLDKFVTQHSTFVLAYTTGNTQYDESWYCRMEKNSETSHDGLIATYLGIVRFLHYVSERIVPDGQ